jgi:hypothetical protein
MTNRCERQGHAQHNEEQVGRDFRNVRRQRVGNRLFQVVKDDTTLFDTQHDRREIVVLQARDIS